MTIFAAIVAWLCVLWSALSFAMSILRAMTGNLNQAERNEAFSIAWLIAGGVFFLVAGA